MVIQISLQKVKKINLIIVQVYVDDIMFRSKVINYGRNLQLLYEKGVYNEHHRKVEFLSSYLVKQEKKGTFLNQSKYAKKLMRNLVSKLA